MDIFDKAKLSALKGVLKMAMPYKDKGIGILHGYLNTLPLDREKGEFQNSIIMNVIGVEGEEGYDVQFAVMALKMDDKDTISLGTEHSVVLLSKFVDMASDIDGILANLPDLPSVSPEPEPEPEPEEKKEEPEEKEETSKEVAGEDSEE